MPKNKTEWILRYTDDNGNERELGPYPSENIAEETRRNMRGVNRYIIPPPIKIRKDYNTNTRRKL